MRKNLHDDDVDGDDDDDDDICMAMTAISALVFLVIHEKDSHANLQIGNRAVCDMIF